MTKQSRPDGVLALKSARWEGFDLVRISRGGGHHTTAHAAVAIAASLVDLPGSVVRIDGLSEPHRNTRRGEHCILPADCEMSGRWSSRTDYLIVRLDSGFFDQMANDHPSVQAAPRAGVMSPAVFSLMQLLLAELETGGQRGRLYRESVAVALAIAALGSKEDKRTASAAPSVRRAMEYITAHLDMDLSVFDLAEVGGTSVRQLSRGFRAATGVSPHRYLMERRIEHARSLLSGTDQPIAAISAQCGFKTTSHFTRVYRQVTGLTPAADRSAKFVSPSDDHSIR